VCMYFRKKIVRLQMPAVAFESIFDWIKHRIIIVCFKDFLSQFFVDLQFELALQLLTYYSKTALISGLPD